jgi:hypothetical protein
MNFLLFKAVLQAISCHPVQQVRHFLFHLIDRLKMSSFPTHYSEKSQVAKSGEWGGVRVLECTYRLKTASSRGRCELAHCLVAESMISSSTIPTFSSSLVLRAWSGPPSSNFD